MITQRWRQLWEGVTEKITKVNKGIGIRENFQRGRGSKSIQIVQIVHRIAWIDRFLTNIKFLHAGKLLEVLFYICNRVLNVGSGGGGGDKNCKILDDVICERPYSHVPNKSAAKNKSA